MVENLWYVLNTIGNFEMNFGIFIFKPIYLFYLGIIIGILRLFIFRSFSPSNSAETKGNSKYNSQAFKKNRGDTR